MKELNCNEVVNQWGNFGDNNPIEYGTKFVKADTENEGCYHVIVVESLAWTQGEDGWFLSQCYVDLNDTWIDWNKITEFSGIQRYDETEEEYKASALVEYYGIYEFNGEPLSNEFGVDFNGVVNEVKKEAEVIALLNEYDIMLERKEEVLKTTVIYNNESEFFYTLKDDVESISETVDGEGVLHLSDYNKIVVSESLEQLQTMLEGYDVEVMTEEEEEEDNE
ncbi:hypothetical protein HOBO_273 [Bacillus phage Hobo]|uniref:Uncharacterized protein n=2 Tax=Caeruleovirus BM15 TaxID=1985178 RepID=A0A0S2MUA8_9CAUD|nr:hypothetical protein FD732_gp012 [Bacillus phage BM15]YP_009626826.1 hypothetical protein FD732_gp068 [Bacillus phage BM15]AXQ66793.1 hypothetical protein HOBO_12 [Bacillus phage Hobo]ALO79433.1 hypothetical protein BM10_12 [Bacillus phage BM15]ALO79681.1 hypothetical protein BM10_277 [Bacillus phage BM15]AXQ67028.1 hypothetical protein HOBO_273 [Bacillus phage Hobo]